MNQMNVKKLKELLNNYDDEEVVYIGDDEELNGMHGAYFIQEINGKEAKEISYGSFTNGGILIS